MNRYICDYIVTLLCLFSSMLFFTACTPDEYEVPGYVEEGMPATVSLKLDLAEFAVKSRADMNADIENRVECLWLAIYNARTGERTFSQEYTPGKDFPESVKGTLSNIKTSSGNSYIVAVANYKSSDALDLASDSENVTSLENLLKDADSWDKYRSIAIRQHFDGDNIRIEVPAQAVVMQGSYRASGHATGPAEDETVETVAIQPGANSLSGTVHLRRIWAQNKFIIKPSDNIISLELVDIQVINVPVLTWLSGRPQGDGSLGYANAGDAFSPDMPSDLSHPMYLESPFYTTTSMTVTTDDKGRPNYEFDYWQFENKRTGKAATYADREREIKNDDGTNTGIYASLCNDAGEPSLGNNATCIRFTAKIKYIVDNIDSPDAIAGDIGNVKYRNAEATYVVHLGYINDDASDFNCFRNSRYTYNITVKSVDQILLEAFKEGENQPGAEGSVTDVTDEFFELDAHYNVFNIFLSKTELEGFTFTMTSYEDNAPHTITNVDDPSLGITANVPAKGSDDWKYYSWIQLIENGKTEQYSSIAKFPDLTNNEGDKILYLDDIRQKASELKDGEGYCFTVYVKEYTYEIDDPTDPDYGNESTAAGAVKWPHYVHQPSRTANFNVAYRVSADKESQHFKAKYALSQRSIQTYYDISSAVASHGTALGVEHLNEVFGMDLRWTSGVLDSDYDANNGRYNVWMALNGTANGTVAGRPWEDESAYILDLSKLLYVEHINNTDQTAYANHLTIGATTRYVPAMQTIPKGKLTGTAGICDGKAGSQDPQTGSHPNPQYIQAIFSCMNRNKDENGNGKIDAEELKWYLPASGKYVRVIIGRNNLVTPLMAYEQETLPKGCSEDFNTLYHFISSDRKIVWADEGMSSSMFTSSNTLYGHAPWQLRCVRNLGTDLTTVSSGEKVTPAYDDSDISASTKGGVVKPTRYYGSALRNPTNLPLPPHKTSSPYNRLGQYGFEIAPAGNNNTTSYSREAGRQAVNYNTAGTTVTGVTAIAGTYAGIVSAINSASPCEKLNKASGRKGWRIPNQKEVVIMLRAGVYCSAGYVNYGYSRRSLTTTDVNWGGNASIMCCTQEHWPSMTTEDAGTLNTNPVNSSDALSGKNRWCTVIPNQNIASAKKHDVINVVRCVRDLTAAEANMTYEQILQYRTN